MVSLEDFAALKTELFGLQNENFDLNVKNKSLLKEIELLKNSKKNEVSFGEKILNKITDNDEKAKIKKLKNSQNELLEKNKLLENHVLQLEKELKILNKSREDDKNLETQSSCSTDLKCDHDVRAATAHDKHYKSMSSISLKSLDNVKKRDKSDTASLRGMLESDTNYSENNSKNSELTALLDTYKIKIEGLENQILISEAKLNELVNKYENLQQLHDSLTDKYDFIERSNNKFRIGSISMKDMHAHTVCELNETVNVLRKDCDHIKQLFSIYSRNIYEELLIKLNELYGNAAYLQKLYTSKSHVCLHYQTKLANLEGKHQILINFHNKKNIDIEKCLLETSQTNITNSTSVDSMSFNRETFSSNAPSIHSSDLEVLLARIESLQTKNWEFEEKLNKSKKMLNIVSLQLQKKNSILYNCFGSFDDAIINSNYNPEIIAKYIKTHPQSSKKIIDHLLFELDQHIQSP